MAKNVKNRKITSIKWQKNYYFVWHEKYLLKFDLQNSIKYKHRMAEIFISSRAWKHFKITKIGLKMDIAIKLEAKTQLSRH